jgi:hypothetical protein
MIATARLFMHACMDVLAFDEHRYMIIGHMGISVNFS